MTTNIKLLAVRRRWCHCSFERNDHVIKKPRHVFSYVFLECHFSSGQTIRYFAQQVYILAETCVTLNETLSLLQVVFQRTVNNLCGDPYSFVYTGG
jgi:hypothetical protein